MLEPDIVDIIAREHFNSLNECSFDDQTEYVKGMWLNDASDALNKYDMVLNILKHVEDPNTLPMTKWLNGLSDEQSCLGTTLFVNAARYMINGVDKGFTCPDDVMWWVKEAQHSNSYGESPDTYAIMEQFEDKLLSFYVYPEGDI